MARNVHQEIKSTLVWIALATVVGVVGIWQAKLAIGQGLHPALEKIPPPLKTRHAVRPPSEVFTGNTVEDYTARCIRGLTDREIGWIVEDFRNAGLAFVDFTHQSTDEELLAYRAAQQQWYHGALKDGLRLTAAQSSEAGLKLNEILREVRSEFERDRKKSTSSQPPEFDSSRFDILLSHGWLFLAYDDESPSMFRFMPWDLCTLTPGQSEVTRFRAFSQHLESSQRQSSQPSAPGLEQDFQSELPFDDDIDLPYMFGMADAVFPYLKSQKFVVTEDADTESPASFLKNIRRLHPAQFRMMLLFYPNLGDEIQLALDKAGD